MKTLTVVATSDFNVGQQAFAAGELVATIQTDLEVGELTSLLRNASMVAVQTEYEPEAKKPKKQVTTKTPDATVSPANDAPGVNAVVAPNDANSVPEGDQRELSTVIDKKSARLLYEQADLTTVDDLRKWLAAGNDPVAINGIGNSMAAKLLEDTGLSVTGPK